MLLQLQPLVKYESDRTLPGEWWMETNTGKAKLVLIVKEKGTEEPTVRYSDHLVFGVYLQEKGYEVSW